MIAEEIYKGKTAEELGLSAESYNSRLQTLNEFLAIYNESKPFQREYLSWLKTSQDNDTPKHEVIDHEEGQCCGKKPTKKEMAKDIVDSAKKIIKSKIKKVDDKTYNARYGTCSECRYLIKGRCMKCGCFMKIKTKFAAMKCPIGLW